MEQKIMHINMFVSGFYILSYDSKERGAKPFIFSSKC